MPPFVAIVVRLELYGHICAAIVDRSALRCLILRLPSTRLIDELKRLPGIGQKTAQRLAFYLLRVDRGSGAGPLRRNSRSEGKGSRMLDLQQYHR